ncbi:MAG: pantoate--beta-alanine ligase [Planctomycetota bacterium]|jgi:pantoate--beta-alanine ligase|nr:pantoate--beta-alanine ligase [Planctomycetota bacterium]
MELLNNHAELRTWRQQFSSDHKVGLVPTMGALHKAHATLFLTARPACDQLLASVFINPLQFERTDDLKAYPRTLEEDLEMLENLGVDAVYLPTPEDMYPAGFATSIDPGESGVQFEGAARPGHFAGVLTVVLKLFQRCRPTTAYFGQKDAQQLFLVQRMVRDLDLPLTVQACPTLREDDGLAFSSRNARLSAAGRQQALVLHRALTIAQDAFQAGERDPRHLEAKMRECFTDSPAKLAYADVVDEITFKSANASETPAGHAWRALIGARLEGVHLLDNLPLGNP